MSWRERFRPISAKATVFALPASILGGFTGAILYAASICWNESTDCTGYSPVGVFIAYALAWPFMTILNNRPRSSHLAEGVAFLLLLFYYYGLIYAGIYLWRLFRSR